MASDDDDFDRPAMRNVNAADVVAAAPETSRNDSSNDASLTRRTSIMEPIDTVYEPSTSSHYLYESQRGSRYGDPSTNESPIEPVAAYAQAAAGYGVGEISSSSPRATPPSSPTGQPRSGQHRYHSFRSGLTSPTSAASRSSGHALINGYR